MKLVLAVVVLTLFATAAQAASPEENYISARDAAIARMNPPGDPPELSDERSKEDDRAREDLAKLLRTLIGPVKIKGFSGEGTNNVGSLIKGFMETGLLDGLLFTRGKEVSLIVTTPGLADRWIKAPDGLAAAEGAVPKDIRSALLLDDFYTRAIMPDSAVGNMGELPVTKPAGVDFVYAMLAARRQDFFPVPAKELLIGVIAGPRVYVVSAPIEEIKMMAPCEKLFKDAVARANRLYEDPKESVTDEADGLREKGDEAMRKCFGQRVRTNPAYVRATKQAQEIVNSLAAR